jgi:hypothetical protein
MHTVATQAAGGEACAQLLDCGCEIGRVQRLQRQGMTQQQGVGALLAVEEFHHLCRPLLVKQPVGIGGEQVMIGWVDRQRFAKVFLGGIVQAGTRRHFGEHRQHPGPDLGLRFRLPREQGGERIMTLAQAPRDAGQSVGTRGPDDLRCQAAKRGALIGGGVERALHLQNRRAREACLSVARVAAQQYRQVRQSGVEIVRALAQGRPHQQHLGRRFGLLPPLGQRSLGVAGKTRIALDPPQFGVATRERNGEIEPLRLAREFRTQRTQLAGAGIGSVRAADAREPVRRRWGRRARPPRSRS